MRFTCALHKTALAGTLGALVLSACSSGDSGRFALMEGLVFKSASTAYPRTQAEVDAYPYAQLGVIYDSGRPGIAVLAEYVEGNHLWVASDRFVLLSSPAGRPLNLQVNGTFWRTAELAEDPLALKQPRRAGDQYRYARPLEIGRNDQSTAQAGQLQCVLTAGEEEVIRQIQREIKVRRWDESCEDKSGQVSTWTVWIDAAGRMRRATGTVAPGARALRLDVLKVPA